MIYRTGRIDGIEVLTLDSPPVNALGIEEVRALGDYFESYGDRAPLVLTAAGRAFSAGVDTKRFAAYDARQRERLFEGINRMTAALLAIRTPVVIAINGHALGGGLVIALCTDYRVAVDGEHRFGLTEAAAGVPFPAGPVEIIRHEIPAPLLRRMTLASRVVTAAELAGQGVFDELVESEELLSTALGHARELASQPAFIAVKRQLRGELGRRLTEFSTASLAASDHSDPDSHLTG